MTMTQTGALPRRADIPREHTWNSESVFADAQAWEAALNSAAEQVGEMERFQGRLHEGPGVLVDAMALMEDLYRQVGTVYFYSAMQQACDTADQSAAAMAGRAGALIARALASFAFLDPELLAIGRGTLERWMQDEPRLAYLSHYIDNLFRRQEHVRSAEVEELLGMASDPMMAIEQTGELLSGADMQFKPAVSSTGEELPVAQATIDTLMSSPDREVRRTAFDHYTDSYLALKNTFASNLIARVKMEVFQARARRYSSALEGSLFANNIPVAVFQNLIETVRQHLPLWHRYWRIRRKALGVETLNPYDIWAPLTAATHQVTYPQAVDWICEGLGPLGSEYVDTLRRGCLEQRWVDIYPNQGKRQGAFSFGWHGTYPFILMSFSGDVESMSTLSHELGHSMHSYLTWKTHPVIYGRYSMFVAEVASNFNQAMVRAHLLNTVDDRDFQIRVLEEAMSNFHRYFFIMPTLARFEQEMYRRTEEGHGVTADDLNTLMTELFEEGYGGEMHVDPDRVGITWATFGHLYQPFYVYQYATGISAANALASRILRGEPDGAAHYVQFLAAGDSVYPLDALKIAGVDMTTPAPIEEAFGVLEGLIDRLEKLVG